MLPLPRPRPLLLPLGRKEKKKRERDGSSAAAAAAAAAKGRSQDHAIQRSPLASAFPPRTHGRRSAVCYGKGSTASVRRVPLLARGLHLICRASVLLADGPPATTQLFPTRMAMRTPTAAITGPAADFSSALPSPTSSSAAPCHSSSGRHYYLAVDRTQFKMRTLLELLGVVADRRGGLPIATCVSSRDELDAVCAAVANLSFVSMSPLYSDQAEAERASILEKFRQETIQWNQSTKATNIAESSKLQNTISKLNIIVATDACLPQAAMAEAPLMARVLINYELPTKKEAYLRRMSTCLAADGIVINMVVGGEVATLKALEENSGLLIAEMPIHVSEIL